MGRCPQLARRQASRRRRALFCHSALGRRWQREINSVTRFANARRASCRSGTVASKSTSIDGVESALGRRGVPITAPDLIGAGRPRAPVRALFPKAGVAIRQTGRRRCVPTPQIRPFTCVLDTGWQFGASRTFICAQVPFAKPRSPLVRSNRTMHPVGPPICSAKTSQTR